MNDTTYKLWAIAIWYDSPADLLVEDTYEIPVDHWLNTEEAEEKLRALRPQMFDWCGSMSMKDTDYEQVSAQDSITHIREHKTLIKKYEDETWQRLYIQAGGEGEMS